MMMMRGESKKFFKISQDNEESSSQGYLFLLELQR